MKWRTLGAAAFLIAMGAVPVASQTLTISVTGTGKVTGTGIDCPSDCSEAFQQTLSRVRPGRSRTVVLTATGWGTDPVNGAATWGSGPNWGGACQGTTGSTCTVTVPAGGATVSAGFATVSMPDVGGIFGSMQDAMILAPSTVGPGTVTSSTSGTSRTHRAEPNAGASFAGWSGACTGTDLVCTHSLGGTVQSLKASFGWPVTVVMIGGGGRVTGPGIDCPMSCTAVAVPPTLILEATAIASVSLKEWGGDCKTAGSTTSGAVCSLAITGPKSVSAGFQATLLTPSGVPPSP